jgi:hypothetical protein
MATAALLISSALSVVGLAQGLSIEVENKASNGFTVMRECDNLGHLGKDESKTLTLSGANKLFVVPDGCTEADGCFKDCKLACSGCFYISAVASPSGKSLVSGIGYGANTPVRVHNGISQAMFSAVNQHGKLDSVSCTETSCDFHHIIQAQGSSGKFVVGDPGILMQFENKASNGVTLMKGCESFGHFAPGENKVLSLTGANKLSVVPDGCTQAEGCYDCHFACLGCFYISAIASVDGRYLVSGIGYGANQPVVEHDGVSQATFSATNQRGDVESVACTPDSCPFNHIIQAQGSSGKFSIASHASVELAAPIVL